MTRIFGHSKTWEVFKREDGVTPLRPFSSTEEMDETMVKNWNDTVRPNDTVYHLGDVVINRKALKTVSRLVGRKILIKGNHDIFKLHEYVDLCGFEDIRAYSHTDGMLLAHVPVHPESLGRWRCQVHGHLHAGIVKLANKHTDPRYINVSVEQINYTPISLEEIRKKILS